MRAPTLLFLPLFAMASCGGSPAPPSPPSSPVAKSGSSSVAFDYAGPSWIRIPATVGTTATHVFFDTGGGITILSETLCKAMSCVPIGSFTGKRMSGQAITLKLSRIPSLTIAGHTAKDVPVAILDTSSLLHPDLGVDGVVGLDVVRDAAITIDYAAKKLVVEDAASLAARRAAGTTVKVRVENEGPSTVVYLPLTIDPKAPPIEMEVDTGSFDLVLDERFMAVLGIDPSSARKVEGHDETQNPYTRYNSTLPRSLAVPTTPNVEATIGSKVMFQKIIHDGLVGHTFLSAHTVTFDVPGAQMIFER